MLSFFFLMLSGGSASNKVITGAILLENGMDAINNEKNIFIQVE